MFHQMTEDVLGSLIGLIYRYKTIPSCSHRLGVTDMPVSSIAPALAVAMSSHFLTSLFISPVGILSTFILQLLLLETGDNVDHSYGGVHGRSITWVLLSLLCLYMSLMKSTKQRA